MKMGKFSPNLAQSSQNFHNWLNSLVGFTPYANALGSIGYTATHPLKDIADRKIEGYKIHASPSHWDTWTPSAANKMYQLTRAVTRPIHDGTLLTMSEGIAVVRVETKGTFFEAYSAQKFSVNFIPFFVDKDDVVASAETAWTHYTNPKDYVVSHHTDVLSLGKVKTVSARLVGPSLWYVKFNISKISDNLIKEYQRQVGGQIRDATKLNNEPLEGYLEIQMVAGNTTDINYNVRAQWELITAQADMV
jgi:hypothetical protein